MALLLIMFLLEKIYDFAYNNNLEVKSTYVLKNKIDADIVFLGPCEPLIINDPKIIEEYTKMKTYNLATNHSCFAENYLHFYLYLKNNKPPKYLFLYVTNESLDGDFNLFNTFRFPHLLNDTVVANTVKDKDPTYYKYSWIPFMKYSYYNYFVIYNVAQGIKHFLFNIDYPEYHKYGYKYPEFPKLWDTRLEKILTSYPNGYYYRFNKAEIKYLLKIIELAKRNNTKLILFESPVLNEYKPYMKNRKEMLDLTHKLATENKIEYWVFDTLDMCNDRNNFFSILITHKKSSDIFTKKLCKYFIENCQLNNSVNCNKK